MSRVTLLLVSVGGAVSDGVLKAMEAHRDRVRIVGVSSTLDTLAARLCDKTHLVAPVARGRAFADDLRAVFEEERPDLALAMRDADLASLAAFKEADPALAGALLAGSTSWAQAMMDKRAMHDFATTHGVRMAPTAATREEVAALVADRGFPIIAKPRRGSGSVGIRVVLSWDQLNAAIDHGGLVFQPFIDPPADLAERLLDTRTGIRLTGVEGLEDFVAVRGIVDRQGGLAGAVVVDVRHRFGRSHHLILRPMDDDAGAMALAMAEGLHALGYAGPFGAQCRRDRDGGLVAFEMLSRFGASTAGYAFLGFPEVELTMRLFTDVDLPPPAPPRAGKVEWVPVPVAMDGRS